MRNTGRVTIDRLEDHPDLPLILDVLSRLSHLTDGDLTALAANWTNTPTLTRDRDQALSPDSPLVLEVLAAFSAIEDLFADDISGAVDYVYLAPSVVLNALRAVRDALAAAYAKPLIGNAAYKRLALPWTTVMGGPTAASLDGPDLGPAADQVRAVIEAAAMLAKRCHDEHARHRFDTLASLALNDEASRDEARDVAFAAAIATSRRRTWALLRRSVNEQITRGCTTCGPVVYAAGSDLDRVVRLASDSACALLVADVATEAAVEHLTAPLSSLIPSQRPPSD